MYSPTRNRGNIAEDMVSTYLQSNGHTIDARNYLKKWGELDIVASKNGKIYFIEVKSVFLNSYFVGELKNSGSWKTCVSHETGEFQENMSEHSKKSVSRETESDSMKTHETFDPVWNMTSKKKKSLSRVINSYISEKFRDETPDFQVDLISVSLDCSQKIGYIKRIANIVLEI